jgi:hypothetical protein
MRGGVQGAAVSSPPTKVNLSAGESRSISAIDLPSLITLPQNVFCMAQFSFHRIASNVSHAISKVLLIANKSVKIVALP